MAQTLAQLLLLLSPSWPTPPVLAYAEHPAPQSRSWVVFGFALLSVQGLRLPALNPSPSAYLPVLPTFGLCYDLASQKCLAPLASLALEPCVCWIYMIWMSLSLMLLETPVGYFFDGASLCRHFSGASHHSHEHLPPSPPIQFPDLRQKHLQSLPLRWPLFLLLFFVNSSPEAFPR